MQLQEAFFDIDQRQRRAPIWVVTKKFDKFDRDLKADIESSVGMRSKDGP